MPVTLTVSQVRDALYLGEGSASSGRGVPTTSVLGQWFHEGLTRLVTSDSPDNSLAALAEVDADLDAWKETLGQRLYEQFAGPRLTQNRAALHESAQQVQIFWQALESACDWIAELSWSLRPERAGRRTNVAAPWQSLADVVQTDQPLTCELREPGWTDSVRLVGIADAIVRLSTTGAWCVLEFKSGQTAPAADLGQACLYHMILAEIEKPGRGPSTAPGALAVVSFQPERHEILFSEAELADARQRLLDLIGRLANVVTPTPRLPSDPATINVGAITSQDNSPISSRGIVANENHLEMGNQIITTFAEYGVSITLDQPIIAGPAFVRFPIILGPKTKVAAVEKRAPELQVRLGLRAEPFIAREEGRLVIDVQRLDRQMVDFDSIRSQLPAPDPMLGRAIVPVGVNLEGRLVIADLSRPEHAHLLVAGTTGSGKSEWLRLAIAGLIVSNTPETLRLLVIDPKRNAFHALRGSPYLWQPLVFPDEQPTVDVLERLCDEMDARYRRLDGADTIADLVMSSNRPLPRIVCICDEYRDLISRSPQERKQIEGLICRLGAKARAAGIHLILATQEPSRETIKGPLDSNMPARIGLRMSRHLESNMLLGEAGAEKLLGDGDLLFKDVGSPRRLQAPLLSAANRQAIFGSA